MWMGALIAPVVLYNKAEPLNVWKIEAELNNPTSRFHWKQFDSYSAELLERVRRGLLASKYTKRSIKDSCRSLWNL